MSDEEHPSGTPPDSSTEFNPPAEPGQTPASAKARSSNDRTNATALGIAVVVVLAIVVGGYFLFFAQDKGPFAFSGEIASPGGCAGSTSGFSAKMLAPDGSVIAQGPFKQHGDSSACTITFAFDLPKADKYQFGLGLSQQVQAVAGTNVILGPTYTFDDLKGQDFHIKLNPNDFTPPSPAPAPAPSGVPTMAPPGGPSMHPVGPSSAPKSP